MIKCRNCLYATTMVGKKYACGYCLFTGHMRGCDVDNCTKFEKKNKKDRTRLEKSFSYVSGKKDDEYVKYMGEVLTKGREV